MISTAALGTTTYTFTPAAGQCAATTTMDIVVTAAITPTFTQIGPLCQGSAAPLLPVSSTNIPAITGTWSPAVISTAALGTTTYTFTPAAGQCAASTTMDIVVTSCHHPDIYSDRSAMPGIGSSFYYLSASTNIPAITGTWSPAVITTAAPGTTTYTFTPAAGQCAASTTMDIVVTAAITPTFTQIGPLCQGSVAPLLPASSTNIPAITGTWSPAVISTAAPGTTTYTFTPAAGQCAASTTMDIVVTAAITPTFTQIGPLCQGSAAPLLPVSFN